MQGKYWHDARGTLGCRSDVKRVANVLSDVWRTPDTALRRVQRVALNDAGPTLMLQDCHDDATDTYTRYARYGAMGDLKGALHASRIGRHVGPQIASPVARLLEAKSRPWRVKSANCVISWQTCGHS